MSFVGIDIGNDTSVVAVAKKQAVQVLPNNDAKYETPSVVSFAQKKRLFGSQAVALASRNPEATISQIKRFIGKRYRRDGVVKELNQLPFSTSEGPDGGILIHVNYAGQDLKLFTPQQIMAMLFSNLKKMIETNLETSARCVIGVPSYFTNSERIAYLDAAEVAGMDRSSLQLMHEGTATALGYGFYKNEIENGTVVVFVDVGHCATQVTVVTFQAGGMRVLSHSSDRNIGGRNFDRVLFDYFRKKFYEEHKVDIVARRNWRACARLMAACEKAKKVLTSNSEASISVECLADEHDASGFITRKNFETMVTELLFGIVETCKKALSAEGIDVRRVSSVELTGSGSRIPAVSEFLSQYFGKKVSRTLNGSECVARGCALQSVLTSGVTSSSYKVTDVFPFTVGYVAKPADQLMFLRGQPFPHSVEYTFDLRDSFHLDIYQVGQDEPPNSSNTRRFQVGPFQIRGNQHRAVKLNISLSPDGIVLVNAMLIQRTPHYEAPRWLPLTGIPDYGMQQGALLEAKKEENVLKSRDREIDDIQEERNTLEAYVYETQKKFADRYDKFASDVEKKHIRETLIKTENWLYEDSDDIQHDVYPQKLSELAELIRPIEDRYVNSEHIDKAAKAFECQIDNIKKETSSWTADRQINEIKTICDEADQWLLALRKFLHLSPKNVRQVLLVNEITEATKTLIKSFERIKKGEVEKLGYLSTAIFSALSLPKKCAGFVGSIAQRSFLSDPRNDALSDKLTRERKHSNLTCDNRSQVCGSPVPFFPVSRSAVCHSVKPDRLNQEECSKKEALDAHLSELLTRFVEWFGNTQKDELSNKLKQIMDEVDHDKLNIPRSDVFGRVEEIVKFYQNPYLDEEANAPAVRDLFYYIFQYRVQVIPARDFVKQTIHNKCIETEEWLKDRMTTQDKKPKYSNTALRVRDILEKMGDLQTLYQTTVEREASQEYHAELQNKVIVTDEEKKNVHEEDGSSILGEAKVVTTLNVSEEEGGKDIVHGEEATSDPPEIKVPSTEEIMDVDGADRQVKEEDSQWKTSNSQTCPLKSDVSLPSHHFEIQYDGGVSPAAKPFNTVEAADISKNDDQVSVTGRTVDLPHVPGQHSGISGDETWSSFLEVQQSTGGAMDID